MQQPPGLPLSWLEKLFSPPPNSNGSVPVLITLDPTSAGANPGDCLALSSNPLGEVTRAVTTALTNAGTVYGVALTQAAPGKGIWAAIGGAVSPLITGLGPTSGYALLNPTTGRIVQASSFTAGDYPVGFIDGAGWLNLCPFLNVAGGGGSTSTVTSIWPSLGATGGGMSVTITGTGFSGTPSVSINGVPATSVIVVSTTKITCVTGACSASSQVGNGSVTVGAATGATFTYDPGILNIWKADDAPNGSGNVTGNIPNSGGGGVSMNPTGTPLFNANVLTALDGSTHASVKGTGTQYFSSSGAVAKVNPCDHWYVAKTNTWSNNTALAGSVGGLAFIGPNGTTPQLGCFAGTGWAGTNGDLAVGAFGIIHWQLTGLTSPSHECIITIGTGTPQQFDPGTDAHSGTYCWMSDSGSSTWTGEIAIDVMVDPNATAFGVSSSPTNIEAALHRDFGV